MSRAAKKEAPTIQGRAVPAPTPGDLNEFLAPVKRDIDESIEDLKELSVATTEELVVAAEMLKEIAHRHATLDDKRKSWVEPLKSVASDIDATFRPVLKGLTEGIDLLKEKIAACCVQLEAKRAELLKASTKVKGSMASNLVAKAEAFIAPKLDGVGVTTRWTGEVVDPAKIPAQYLIPDVDGLEAVTEGLGRDPEIPGWRAYPTADVRTTRKGR